MFSIFLPFMDAVEAQACPAIVLLILLEKEILLTSHGAFYAMAESPHILHF